MTSAGGRIEVPVEVTDAIKPGVVSMPHGWGHGKAGNPDGGRQRVTRGEHQRAVAADFIDEPSGNGALNGIPVTVAPVRA